MSAGEESFPPREPRTRMVIPATITGERTAEREILIRNISRRGIGARSRQGAPDIGERVTIRIGAHAEISGTVRWVQGAQFGLLLDRDLDPAIFDPPTATETPRPGIDIFGD
jgi:hypothetical protein